jgi:LPXTG-site transpeptidase (sortase) family protein
VALPPPADPVTPDVPTPTETEAAAPPAHISRLRIPAIGVDAPVEIKSLDGNGVMQAPDSPTVVAWYDFSALPEDQGNVVFAGHLDYAGVGPAVFWELEQVQSGDTIDVVEQGGRVFRYQVTSVESYSATSDASQVVASTGKPTITLITCSGSFDRASQSYSQRIVVTGVLVE